VVYRSLIATQRSNPSIFTGNSTVTLLYMSKCISHSHGCIVRLTMEKPSWVYAWCDTLVLGPDCWYVISLPMTLKISDSSTQVKTAKKVVWLCPYSDPTSIKGFQLLASAQTRAICYCSCMQHFWLCTSSSNHPRASRALRTFESSVIFEKETSVSVVVIYGLLKQHTSSSYEPRKRRDRTEIQELL
jgi:hypothetical protein